MVVVAVHGGDIRMCVWQWWYYCMSVYVHMMVVIYEQLFFNEQFLLKGCMLSDSTVVLSM